MTVIKVLKKALRILPWVLIAAGIIIIGVAVFRRVYTNRQQNVLIDTYLSQMDERAANPRAVPLYPTAAVADTDDVEEPEAQVQLEILPDPQFMPEVGDGGNAVLIGVMMIPSIDLTVPIGEGSDQETMRFTVGHFTETAPPGQEGNFAVVGHRNFTYGQYFNRLDEMEKDDEILVFSERYLYTYQVTEVFVVQPTEVWVLESTGGCEITLITCTPIRTATHRLIVKGVLVSSEEMDRPILG